MAIQTFIDDSKSDGRVLVLAGYVGSASTWAKFAAEWQEALAGPPRWPRFKMSAISYWRQDLSFVRTRRHFEIIRSYPLAAICVAVPIDLYNKVADEYGFVNQDRNPYFLAWTIIVSMLLGFARTKNLVSPIEFIFDDQSEKKQIKLAWDEFYRTIPRSMKKHISGAPLFKKDDDLMPLQAADFLAWWKRKEFEAYGTVCRVGPLFPWDTAPATHENYLYAEVDEARIRRIIRQQLDAKLYTIRASFGLGGSYGRGVAWTS